MLVLLPPSETKDRGGDGPPLDLARLSLPTLTPIRERVVTALVAAADDVDALRATLRLSERQRDEAALDADLRASPTRPAIERYTGVLFDALDQRSLTGRTRERALSRLMIGSALFGVVGAGDPIPAYRFSAGSVLPALGGLRGLWRKPLSGALAAAADHDLVVDLRSGAYAALGPVAGAVGVRVVTEHADGTRTVVSHDNKHTKGLLARALATTRREPRHARDVAAIAEQAGLRAEVDGDVLTIVR